MPRLRTEVAIIGGGPAGLLLGQILHQHGIDNVIVELRGGDYVRSRIRAGVLEPRSAEILAAAGVGARLRSDGIPLAGHSLMWDQQGVRIPFELIGKTATVYGQTKITRDLMDARETAGGVSYYEATDVQPHGFGSDQPSVTFAHDGEPYELQCQFIAACDGYHGVSRAVAAGIEIYETAFPFGWLGLLSDTPPLRREVAWINHPDGFVMCSFRSSTRSRYYFQVPVEDTLDSWPVERFWAEFERRLPPELAASLVTGPALEMSIIALRSSVAEPVRFGRMFLVGDAAHVVPPTGAKGLNLAICDAADLADALCEYHASARTDLLDSYSDTVLRRAWKAVRFSWWMTKLMHKFSDDPVERRLQVAELDYLAHSAAAQITIAENFCGLEQ